MDRADLARRYEGKPWGPVVIGTRMEHSSTQQQEELKEEAKEEEEEEKEEEEEGRDCVKEEVKA